MLQNQQFFLSLQKYDRIMSPRSLSPKFSFVLRIPVFKLRCFHFYLIKGPFFLFSTLDPCNFKDGENFAPKLLGDQYPLYLSKYSKIEGFLMILKYFYDQSKNGHFIR